MNTILGFKSLEGEDLEDHPCIPGLRDKMGGFHDEVSMFIDSEKYLLVTCLIVTFKKLHWGPCNKE